MTGGMCVDYGGNGSLSLTGYKEGSGVKSRAVMEKGLEVGQHCSL